MAQILTRPLATLVICALASLLTACAEPDQVLDGTTTVEISDRTYELEIVADQDSRTKGLAGRESIPEGTGMLFVFPESRVRRFVMRGCLVDIDIIFLDGAGRVVTTHHMPAEPLRKDNETAAQYEGRLTKYSSRFNSKYAIEIPGGALEELDLDPGDPINLDTQALDALAR